MKFSALIHKNKNNNNKKNSIQGKSANFSQKSVTANANARRKGDQTLFFFVDVNGGFTMLNKHFE